MPFRGNCELLTTYVVDLFLNAGQAPGGTTSAYPNVVIQTVVIQTSIRTKLQQILAGFNTHIYILEQLSLDNEAVRQMTLRHMHVK